MRIPARKPASTLAQDMSVLATVTASPQPLTTRNSPLWSLEKDGITQSMLTKFLTCKERFRLGYLDGYRPAKVGSMPMEFGNCVHEILDMVYSWSKDHDLREFSDDIMTNIKQACDTFEAVKYEELASDGNDWSALALNVGIAEVLLPQYFDFWKSDWSEITWEALEEVFDIPITVDGVSFRVRGKFDGVCRIKDKLWLFETKTKGKIDEDSISDKLSIDLQVNLYLWAIWKKYGEFPAGVVYNIIRRPQLRQKATETHSEFIRRIKADVFDRPDFYFMRTNGSVHKSEILEWEEQQFMPILRELVQWAKGGSHYRNVSACTSGFFPCEYLPICGQGNTVNFKRRTELFEELTVVPMKNS